ncbi:hypothetical protein [Sinimarinibacterium sp. NLF-5-8]|uniref:hypothetical protein n=1 Tax=Sinimarinibacterium sp. NLF-5-8 TaxID=2698684 RepID=UPI00137C3849|nr:hypothetical protein [Sinimarinibacterium sp. NLF-5-8]QHS09324.1 hypothetical protein GT972_03575 [Sinimarinibacterium sp. NLF-5-8]
MAKMALKPGARLKSAVSDVMLMVVKAPAGEHELTCGGADMIAATAQGGGELAAGDAGEVLIGKRYVNEDESIELLCAKGGKGTIAFNGVALDVKQAKQLPSSD